MVNRIYIMGFDFNSVFDQFCKENRLSKDILLAVEEEHAILTKLKYWIAGKCSVSIHNVDIILPKYKVYRKTKDDFGWTKSFIQYFNQKEEALKYMARQNQLLQVYEGMRGEVMHFGARHTNNYGTEVLLVLEEPED